MQQLQQCDWIDQQIREKKLYEDQQKYTTSAHDAQQAHFANLLGEAQNAHKKTRDDMEKAVKDANAQMAKEKRDRDIAQRQFEQLQATTDVNSTQANDFMTENPATEQSMLGAHRVKPYHFKGMNANQRQQIMDERAC